MPWHGIFMSTGEEDCSEAVESCKCPFCHEEAIEITELVQIFQCPHKCGGILIPGKWKNKK